MKFKRNFGLVQYLTVAQAPTMSKVYLPAVVK